jgi:hypothetical protein
LIDLGVRADGVHFHSVLGSVSHVTSESQAPGALVHEHAKANIMHPSAHDRVEDGDFSLLVALVLT